MNDPNENDFDLDDETIAAINEGEAQADQGLGEDLDSFRARLAERLSVARAPRPCSMGEAPMPRKNHRAS